MINLETIQDIQFNYYDENGYVYHFILLEKIDQNKEEAQFNMICQNTNPSANGAVFLIIKYFDNSLFFRTNYFANSKDFIKLNEVIEKSNQNNKIYSINFGKDTFELELTFS